jgi:hypothetical protein
VFQAIAIDNFFHHSGSIIAQDCIEVDCHIIGEEVDLALRTVWQLSLCITGFDQGIDVRSGLESKGYETRGKTHLFSRSFNE